MADQRRPGPGRFLAPIALGVFVVAFFLVVLGSTGGGEDEQAGQTNTQQSAGRSDRKEPTTDTTETTKAEKASYTVKTGDTLAGIAEENGVTVEQIQELNPELDPQALVSGQKIKLRE